MKRTDLMRDIPKHLHEGGGIECRAIGREAAEGQGTCRQGRVQTPQKGPDIIVGGIVIQDVREDPFVVAIIDCRQNAEGTLIQFIGGHIARKIHTPSDLVVAATRGRKVDRLARWRDQTCCSISSILRRCAGR